MQKLKLILVALATLYHCGHMRSSALYDGKITLFFYESQRLVRPFRAAGGKNDRATWWPP